jgi:ABC-2 type transport system permease protein
MFFVASWLKFKFMTTFLPSLSLCQRELVRFVRQRNRIVGALATPLVFWLLLGAGLGHSFKAADSPEGGFIRFFFPGTIVMILLFTAIFSTISVIEDRREGFLQSVLVAPVSRMSVVLGKVLGGTLLAFGQGLLFLALAPTVKFHFTIVSLLAAMGMMLLMAFALTSLGFCLAWRMSSTAGFHAIMNLFLMPMWFLSGALFPASGAMGPMQTVMRFNPLTYGLAGLRRAMDWGQIPPGSNLPRWGNSVGGSAAFALVMFLLACWVARKTTSADLQ